MLGLLILSSPLLLLILLLWYVSWGGTADSDGYSQSPAGFGQYHLDHFMAVAGGISLSLVIGAFSVDGRDMATFVIAMIKGGLCTMIGMGVLITILRSLRGLRPRLIVYGVVLLLIWLCTSQDQQDNAAHASATANPMVGLADLGHRGAR